MLQARNFETRSKRAGPGLTSYSLLLACSKEGPRPHLVVVCLLAGLSAPLGPPAAARPSTSPASSLAFASAQPSASAHLAPRQPLRSWAARRAGLAASTTPRPSTLLPLTDNSAPPVIFAFYLPPESETSSELRRARPTAPGPAQRELVDPPGTFLQSFPSPLLPFAPCTRMESHSAHMEGDRRRPPLFLLARTPRLSPGHYTSRASPPPAFTHPPPKPIPSRSTLPLDSQRRRPPLAPLLHRSPSSASSRS
jgi:hypothetical protein